MTTSSEVLESDRLSFRYVVRFDQFHNQDDNQRLILSIIEHSGCTDIYLRSNTMGDKFFIELRGINDYKAEMIRKDFKRLEGVAFVDQETYFL